jgi:hypothetical protein
LRVEGKGVILVTRGDARVDTKKFRLASRPAAHDEPGRGLAVTDIGGRRVPLCAETAMDFFLDEGLRLGKGLSRSGVAQLAHRDPARRAGRITGASRVDVCRDSRGMSCTAGRRNE